jgi:hypothetical protein
MALPALPELSLFMGLVLVLSLYWLTASGHFPEEHRAASLKTAGGQALLWGTMIIAALLTLAALVFAWARLPISAAVIGGGLMVLVAPLLLQPLPDSFVDGRRGLVIFIALGTALALLGSRLIA